MNWIVIAIMAAVIVSLMALSLWFAKKEDEELADMRRRFMELENDKEEDDDDEHLG